MSGSSGRCTPRWNWKSTATSRARAFGYSQALQDVWGSAELWLSERLCAALVQHPSAEYVDFRSKGPITPHQLAAVLRPYGIRPIHGLRNHLGGYRRAQFENAWARLLQKPTKDSLPRSRGPGSPKPPRRKR